MFLSRRTAAIAIASALAGCRSLVRAMDAPSAEGDGMIDVAARAGEPTGTLRMGDFAAPCALGRSGILADKREGDGATPAGTYYLRELRYRADRMSPAPVTRLPVFATAQDDGWCDEPKDASYNRLVKLPYVADAENMWREDHLYDLVTIIGYNDRPIVRGAGSAIFMHVAREADGKLSPTAGCVSLRQTDLLRVLATCSQSTQIRIRLI